MVTVLEGQDVDKYEESVIRVLLYRNLALRRPQIRQKLEN